MKALAIVLLLGVSIVCYQNCGDSTSAARALEGAGTFGTRSSMFLSSGGMVTEQASIAEPEDPTSGDGLNGSCRSPAGEDMVCSEWHNLPPGSVSGRQSECSQAGGTWQRAACPTTGNLLGSCSRSISGYGQSDVRNITFYSRDSDSDFERFCQELWYGIWRDL